MKKILLILFVSLSIVSQAQKKGFKMVEHNPKNKPDWVTDSNMKGFLNIQVNEQPSLDQAKALVMNQLLAEIASSVAVTVADNTVHDVDWTNENEKNDFREKVKRTTTTKVQKMPAFQGISLTNADIYWERFYNKKSGEEYYNYYVSYPFSSLDLMELIEAYNAQEKAIDDKIQGFKDGLNNIKNVEFIDKTITEIRALMKKLDSDDERLYTLDAVINNYQKIYDNIFIEEVSNNKGLIVVQLKYDGNIIVTSQRPRVNSNCATKINTNYNGDKFEIRFDSFDCYKQDNNYIEIQYKFGNKFVKKQLYFDI